MNKTNSTENGLQRFAFGRPILFSIFVIFAAGLLTEIPLDALFSPVLADPAPEFLRVLIGHTLTGFLLLGLLAALGMLKSARFTPIREWRAVWLVWPLVLLAMINFDFTIEIDASRPWVIGVYVLMVLAIGFVEEVMGRAVVLSLLLRKWGENRKGIYQAVLVSSLLFGAAHVFNLISGHLTPLAGLTQMIYTVFFGVIFAACFLRNDSIWPVLVMHAAIDFGGGLRHLALDPEIRDAVVNTDLSSVITSLVITLPLLIYGLIILRKVQPDDLVV